MPDAFDMDHLNLLIHLLDDPDQEAFHQVSNEILTLGLPAVEPLEEAWFNTNDNLTRQRIEELVHSLQYDGLYHDLEAWVASGGQDLLRGYLIATRFQYPNLEEEKLLANLNKLTRSVWIELNENLTSLEKVKVLNHMLFGVIEIGGEIADIHVPDHYFLNNLLQSKHGNAVSIGILYIIVAQKLNLPIKGVDLTGNFIACFTHVPSDFKDDYKPTSEVKFYINPFAMGAVFTRKEILLYLEKAGIVPSLNCFKPADNITVLKRWCYDLMKAYIDSGMKEKAVELKKFIRILGK
ncbi:MAG: transglutaminase-like domain-containing protein [Bacteroidales bacterium]|nr:transglutaminase-like domain-containing protein [Bacteroidales bacterium]